MRPGSHFSALFLIGFVIVVFAIALVINPHYPRLVFAGESSVATWVSGMLLVICGTLCLVTANRSGGFPWLVFTMFFFALAIDERFMIHEYIKQRLIFDYPDSSWIVREVAVIVGTLGGGIVSIMLWRQLPAVSRYLLSGAVILGMASVVIDIVDAGVLWEESAKLFGEILITTALLAKISVPDIS